MQIVAEAAERQRGAAERAARADRPMAVGTRIWVEGHGEGWVEPGYRRAPVPLHQPRSGAAEHTIRFDRDGLRRRLRLHERLTCVAQMKRTHLRGDDDESAAERAQAEHASSPARHHQPATEGEGELLPEVAGAETRQQQQSSETTWVALRHCVLRARPEAASEVRGVLRRGQVIGVITAHAAAAAAAAAAGEGAWLKTERGWLAESVRRRWRVLRPRGASADAASGDGIISGTRVSNINSSYSRLGPGARRLGGWEAHRSLMGARYTRYFYRWFEWRQDQVRGGCRVL
eukprot:COSAG01_NODE_495_length_16308_cov_92.317088_6_plen_289_part_00